LSSLEGEISLRAGLIVYGRESLKIRRDSCLWIRDGIIESIESAGSCRGKSIGGPSIILLPQPSNAHVHSADHRFAEYGLGMSLRDLVSYPKGLKHRLLESAKPEELVHAIRDYYLMAWRYGIGVLSDFREGGGHGCALARKAKNMIPRGMEVLLLGRPGPLWPRKCDGLGISSPLDYNVEDLVKEASKFRITAAHIAEDEESRKMGDLEIAMEAGIRIAVHGVFLDYGDLQAMRDRNMSLVACTRSNMWHGIGLPPIKDIVESDVTLGLGTDNAAWSTPDIWEEARSFFLAGRLQGLKQEKLIDKILSSLFIEGYLALGLEPRIIEEGRPARLLIAADGGAGVMNAVNTKAAIIKRIGAHNLIARIDLEKIHLLAPEASKLL